jgi:hypothetical protein
VASAKFTKQLSFPPGSESQATIERIHVTAVSLSAVQHKELFVKTHIEAAQLTLVKPL